MKSLLKDNPLAGMQGGLFALMFFSFVFVHQSKFNSATPVSRLDLLHALSTDRTFQIDRYDNTPDKAVFDGHFYSDKAPGTAALAFPSFAAGAMLLSLAGVPLDSPQGWLASSWVACAASNALLAALGAVALFAWLRRQVQARWALVTTLAVFLGAAPLPYATMMFSHSLVVGCIAIAIWSIAKCHLKGAESEMTHQRASVSKWLGKNRCELLAGFACGWALASEFTAGIVVVGLFLWLLSNGWRRAVPFCFGAIPPLLLIPAYSYACFGTLFVLPYSFQASFPEMQEGLYAIKWPDLDTAFNLLFSPARGLLFWTPFLAMAGFGYYKLARDDQRLFWLTYLLPVLHLVVISGRTWDWPAGNALGPRYLAPILPLLALPCAHGVQRFPKLGVALAAYSILITTLATLTDACPPFSSHPNPLLDLHIPLFLKGTFSPNLGILLGLPSYVSIALFYALLVGGIGCLWRQVTKHSLGVKAE